MAGAFAGLCVAQALVRYLSAQVNEDGDRLVAGVWAIFGHGNVAGLGEALYGAGDTLPTRRGHNEQGIAHAAIAYAKANNRKRLMAVTSSIGPGATNMVTAAALAHVNRLPVLFLPGDVFANRLPDPVLQQVEDFEDGTVSANDCFRPVSRYFDRIAGPEHMLAALPRAMATLVDPAACGPVTLALCQDVQTEACEYPEVFFRTRVWAMRRQRPDPHELERAAHHHCWWRSSLFRSLRDARRIRRTARHPRCRNPGRQVGIALVTPVQRRRHRRDGGFGCIDRLQRATGGASFNNLLDTARHQAPSAIDFAAHAASMGTVATHVNDIEELEVAMINAAAFDATKHDAIAVVGDARTTLDELDAALGDHAFTPPSQTLKADWNHVADAATGAPGDNALPSDAQVIGAVQRTIDDNGIIVYAAGGLPGELHKLWRSPYQVDYHLEYGYSCMGYEIAGGLGVKMARPDADVVVIVGDGSYMMMNSELATSVMLGLKLSVGAIGVTGTEAANEIARPADLILPIGTVATHVNDIEELEVAMINSRSGDRTAVFVIDTDPAIGTAAGGHWWDVAVAEVSDRAEGVAARKA